MEFNNLADIEVSVIWNAFREAFSQYEVKIQLSLEDFSIMLETMNYSPQHSIGCIDEGVLAGFCLIGMRTINGQSCIYDIATGVIPSWQKRHIGSKLLDQLILNVQSSPIDRFYLEVLEHNIPAQRLYEKKGFKRTRFLRIYKTRNIEPCSITGDFVSNEEGLSSFNTEEFCSYVPTWQNSFDTFETRKDLFLFQYLKIDNQVAGYFIINKVNKRVLQLGVSPDYPSISVVQTLLKRISDLCNGEEFTISNVEANSYMDKLFQELNLDNYINQWEMVRDFPKI
ncbi:GNAT family N-acetyltransferase [Spirochaeta cellobiosiphila]|uniref:GNAT family N-acetyltransferase n=1 Tax=Spirochaeta cellobiosiphila TaxID=504483 RepID=UPI0004041149|nr:GNAT family N-acetyltransferase [Spirochaeta cellobiosiphila]